MAAVSQVSATATALKRLDRHRTGVLLGGVHSRIASILTSATGMIITGGSSD
jgi:hypothetical protein